MNYEVKRTGVNTTIYGRESMGEQNFHAHDTTIINKKGNLIRYNSYAVNRTLGYPMGLYVNDIYDYSYIGDSVMVMFNRRHCKLPGIKGVCLEYNEIYLSSVTKKYSKLEFNYNTYTQLKNIVKKNDYYIIK